VEIIVIGMISVSEREVPLITSSAVLLAKPLQRLEVQPDLPAAPLFGLAQPSTRFLGDPSLHPENHDLMQPLASGVEASPEIGFGGPRPGRLLTGSDGTCAIGSSSCRGSEIDVEGRSHQFVAHLKVM
jgi:hypothetical protein